MFAEQLDILQLCACRTKASGRFDIIRLSVRHAFTNAYFFLSSEITCFNDYLQQTPLRRLPNRHDLSGHLLEIPIFYIAQINHHVDLICTVCNGVFRFKDFARRRAVAQWKSNHCT